MLLSLCCVAAAGADYRIRDIGIDVNLQTDGSAVFTEVWDVGANAGTEWYLVKDNLGDIVISDFKVSEGGNDFFFEGEWNVDRSRREKTGRCGTVRKPSGEYELCWGIGEYGSHVFTVSYRMTNTVKSLSDFDAFHMQLVSPGLSARPEHVRVRIHGPSPFTPDVSRIWAFGFEGTAEFDRDGAVILESTERLASSNSVIALIRINKGIFNSTSIQEHSFEALLDRAMEGSDFSETDDLSGRVIGIFNLAIWLLFMLFAAALPCSVIRSRRKILGGRKKDIDWCRDIPFNGDILQAHYTLSRLGMDRKSSVASAMILRMVRNGHILVSKDIKGNVELSFNDNSDKQTLSSSEKGLYLMMQKASGSDRILQRREFSRWSKRNAGAVSRWVDGVKAEGRKRTEEDGNIKGSVYTPEGQQEARKLIGLEKFLKDFTLISERGVGEVSLWHDYLVFAALFGIADQVAGELKEINSEAFKEVMAYDYDTMHDIFWLSRNMAESITNAKNIHESGASQGFGGRTSIGGGGGFSGGGFGGGGR